MYFFYTILIKVNSTYFPLLHLATRWKQLTTFLILKEATDLWYLFVGLIQKFIHLYLFKS